MESIQCVTSFIIFSNQQRINAYNAFSTKALHELIECEDEKRRSIHLNTSAKLLSFLIEKTNILFFVCGYKRHISAIIRLMSYHKNETPTSNMYFHLMKYV